MTTTSKLLLRLCWVNIYVLYESLEPAEKRRSVSQNARKYHQRTPDSNQVNINERTIKQLLIVRTHTYIYILHMPIFSPFHSLRLIPKIEIAMYYFH